MPQWLLGTYERWRPRIEAARTLDVYTAVAAAQGNLPADEARDWLRGMGRVANEGRTREKAQRGNLAALQAMGLNIVHE